MNKFKENFNFYTNILFLFVLIFGGVIWADSNGIWTKAEDVKPGTFGADEGAGMFSFNHFVNFFKNVKMNKSLEVVENITAKNLNISNRIDGKEIYMDGKLVATKDELNYSVTTLNNSINILDSKIGNVSLPVCPAGVSLISNGTNWVCKYKTCEESGGVLKSANTCYFGSAGDYNIQVPSGYSKLKVTVVGAGGSGGAFDSGVWHYHGGSGGGGAIKTISVSPGQVFNLKVGAPQPHGGPGYGKNGFDSYFEINPTTKVIGGGGKGGGTAGPFKITPGGVGSGGDTNCKGGYGNYGPYYKSKGGPGECGGGSTTVFNSGAGGGATPIGGISGTTTGYVEMSSSNKCGSNGHPGCIQIEYLP